MGACFLDKSPTGSAAQWAALSEQEDIVVDIKQARGNKDPSTERQIRAREGLSKKFIAPVVNASDLALLAEAVYGKSPVPPAWKPYTKSGTNGAIGLKIQAYINDEAGVVIVAVAGADPSDIEDLTADLDFAFGGYHPQFRESVEYLAEVKKLAKDDPAITNIGVTGHSLGGGIAQVLSHTFHLPGATFDAPAAGAITSHPEYKRHLQTIGQKEQGIDLHFTNFTEHGSLFSGIIRSGYLGKEVQVNLADEMTKVTGLGALLMQHFMLRLAGTAILAIDQIGPNGQHNLDKFAQYFRGKYNKHRDDNDFPEVSRVFALNTSKITILAA